MPGAYVVNPFQRIVDIYFPEDGGGEVPPSFLGVDVAANYTLRAEPWGEVTFYYGTLYFVQFNPSTGLWDAAIIATVPVFPEIISEFGMPSWAGPGGYIGDFAHGLGGYASGPTTLAFDQYTNDGLGTIELFASYEIDASGPYVFGETVYEGLGFRTEATVGRLMEVRAVT